MCYNWVTSISKGSIHYPFHADYKPILHQQNQSPSPNPNPNREGIEREREYQCVCKCDRENLFLSPWKAEN